MTRVYTTFPRVSELEAALGALRSLGLPFELLSPMPAFGRVGVPCVIVEEEARAALAAQGLDGFVCSGWVDYQAPGLMVPAEEPPRFAEDPFGTAAVMVLAPCVADVARIRITAHLSGDLSPVFPYLNATMSAGCFTPAGPTFTFIDGHRMICLYPGRITIAKADEMVDAWRVLETIRRRVGEVWARHQQIQPSFERHERPPVVEIFRRLPGTNCHECGERTCLAFAARLWRGLAAPGLCLPAFDGRQTRFREPLLEICRGLGLMDEP